LEEALEVLQWIEDMIGIPLNPPIEQITTSLQVSEVLKDGLILCL